MKMEGASPAHLLEMQSDAFGAFEAIAYSTIQRARHVPEDELLMDTQVAEAVLEFGEDLRKTREVIVEWRHPILASRASSQYTS